jgi:hypothetical protein
MGTLPTEMGLWTSLTKLCLSELYNLQGSLPTTLVKLSHLHYFSLMGNFFPEKMKDTFDAGYTVSSFLTSLPTVSLRTLQLSTIRLYGSIPKEITTFQNLTDLHLIDLSWLTGTLPWEMSVMTHLQVLNLAGSTLKGYIPSELGRLSQLTTLNLEQTEICTKPLPWEIRQMTNLKIIPSRC